MPRGNHFPFSQLLFERGERKSPVSSPSPAGEAVGFLPLRLLPRRREGEEAPVLCLRAVQSRIRWPAVVLWRWRWRRVGIISGLSLPLLDGDDLF